jgi:hypothetical protein
MSLLRNGKIEFYKRKLINLNNKSKTKFSTFYFNEILSNQI